MPFYYIPFLHNEARSYFDRTVKDPYFAMVLRSISSLIRMFFQKIIIMFNALMFEAAGSAYFVWIQRGISELKHRQVVLTYFIRAHIHSVTKINPVSFIMA